MEMSWWDDEPEFLGAALSLLGEWDDTSALNRSQQIVHPIGPTPSFGRRRKPKNDADGATDSSSTPSDRSPGPKRAVTINRSRERQKQEMTELQQQIVQLSHELDRLQMRRNKKLLVVRDEADPAARESDAGLAAWESATRRQFNSRRRAEALNAKLRNLVASQALAIEELQRAMEYAARVRQASLLTALLPVLTPTNALCDAASDQELELRLAKISLQWSVPFAHCSRFHHQPESPREIHFFETNIVRDDHTNTVLDIRASTAAPFAKHIIEDNLWQYFLTLSCTEENFSLATTFQSTRDTLRGGFRAMCHNDGLLGILDARLMKQRFRNELGELVLTSTMCGRPGLQRTSGPAVDSELIPIDAVVFEDSWLRVVDASEGDGSRRSTPLTIVQHVRRSRVQFLGPDRPARSQVNAVKRFLAHLAENELRWGQEVTERRLMLGPANLMDGPHESPTES